MCAAAVPIIGALVGAGATVYAANRASADAEEARKQTERQMQMAKEEAARPAAVSQSSTDVTAAIQSNRRRAAAQAGMGSTVTGTGLAYDTQFNQQTNSGLGSGTKKQLGA